MYLRNYNFVCFINEPEFISYKDEEKKKRATVSRFYSKLYLNSSSFN